MFNFDLNTISNIYQFSYNTDTVLYQLFETETLDRTNIGRDKISRL